MPCPTGNGQVHVFDGSKTQNEAKLNKGARYIPFLCDFFDKDKNSALYKGQKNSRILPQAMTKYDSEKVEHQKKCGYVDLQHQRVLVQGKICNYVQILH